MANKLAIFVTEDWYFCLHWLPIAKAAQESGFDVAVITRVSEHGHIIEDAGLTLVPFEISRKSVNPFSELATIRRLVALYKRHSFDMLQHIAVKPVLYGSIAAKIVGIKRVVNTFAGLGWIFTAQTLLAKSLKLIVSNTLSYYLCNSKFIVQNHDDCQLLKSLGIEDITVIRGTGVDTKKFHPEEEPSGLVTIILPARMLWDKGIKEFVEAAQMLKNNGSKACFVLVGSSDPGNPAAASEQQLAKWNEEGIVEWWGPQGNMPEIYKKAHIVCLPSYREGLPTVLTEAAASGRPIVTTDAVGCREVVRHAVNGYIVPVRDSAKLAAALQILIERPDLRKEMGENGRNMAVDTFSVDRIMDETISIYRSMFN